MAEQYAALNSEQERMVKALVKECEEHDHSLVYMNLYEIPIPSVYGPSSDEKGY